MAGRKSNAELATTNSNWAGHEAMELDAMPVAMQKSLVDQTPFPSWYEQSWESGKPLSLRLETDAQIEEAKKLAGIAANRFGRRYQVKAGLRNHVSEPYEYEGKTYRDYTFMAVDRTKVDDTEDLADEVSDEAADA